MWMNPVFASDRYMGIFCLAGADNATVPVVLLVPVSVGLLAWALWLRRRNAQLRNAHARAFRERTRAEETLQRCNERFDLASRAVVEAIWDWRLPSNELTWSEGILGAFGYPHDQVGTGPEWWEERVHPQDRPGAVSRRLAAVSSATSQWEDKYRFRRADGTYAAVLDRGHIGHDSAGNAVRMVGAIMDITDQARAPLQLHDLHDQAAAEKQRLSAQLLQLQKMDAIGKLAGGVAHDFNNILMVVMGCAEFIRERLPDASPVLLDVNELLDAGRRASDLTRQLLAFSRQQVLEKRLIDLNGVVENTRKMLGRLLGEDIELVVEPAGEPVRVKADRGQIAQIVINLAVNARDAMPTGGQLSIRTGHVELHPATDSVFADTADPVSGAFVLLQVCDTGVGLSEDVRGQVFEPFFTTKGHGKGTGLGLSTVYGIVKQHDGHIAVASEIGRGTTFSIYLPQVREMGSEEPTGGQACETPEGQETVLFVEDDTAVRHVAVRMLRDLGYNVLPARNGEEACRVAAEYTGGIQIIVTDVVLPGMDGKTLADKIRTERPEVKVLFSSGYVGDRLRQRGIVSETVALLRKPFTKAELAQKIREVLQA